MKNVKIRNGAVRWIPARTSEPLNPGAREYPAHAEVTYDIQYAAQLGNIYEKTTIVLHLTDLAMDAPHIQLERDAAQQLAPFLRTLADAVQKQVERATPRPEASETSED